MFILFLIHLAHCIPQIEIFMESMCPDTTRFINNSLKNAAIDRIDELVQITFIPNGKQGSKPSKETEFTCQHGEVECYGNMIESCALEYLESTKEKILFLACFQEETRSSKALWDYQLNKCAEGETISKIQGCLHGPEGIEVQHAKRMQTPINIKYVPSFRVNGQLKHGFQDSIQSNILNWACQQNEGNTIEECEEYNL